jgi:hypothetical protein
MNAKTVMAAKELNSRLESMFLPLHRLAWPREGDQPDVKQLFGDLCQAQHEAQRVLDAISVEFHEQLEDISGPE